MNIDLDAARRHLHLLAGEPNPRVAWQVFDDTKQEPGLARSFHGRLDEVLPRLTAAQAELCGVFVAVNETSGRRRTAEHMTRARAIFLDLDGAPLPQTWPTRPDLVIHSSSVDGVDKYQCWWLINPTEDFDTWRRTQKAMALRYGGDLKCSIITQVGRCAGFWHQKRPERPWQVRIHEDNAIDADSRWDLDALVAKFAFDLSTIHMAAAARERVDRPPPIHGWDNDIDIAAARRLVADEENWVSTSDGGVSIFQMACRLRDLAISQDLAVELIESTVPRLPAQADNDPQYVVRKVGNAYRYAANDAGAGSIEADRQQLLDKLVDRDALRAFLEEGGDNE